MKRVFIINYYWIRVYEYCYERDLGEKGILLDEFYTRGLELTREQSKDEVIRKYSGKVSEKMKFAKPKKKDGIYAIVMESDKYFYDRFYVEIDTYCFCCHKPIKGKASEFPKASLSNKYNMDLDNEEDIAYFCNYDCKYKLFNDLKYEGEFQEKESMSEKVFGYIYHMYNRASNKHYVGQTRYLPFFRWQEHIKDGEKGDITDFSFNVLTEVRVLKEGDSQVLLNNIEAWWIAKYIEEGYEVFNIARPKLTLTDYKDMFDDMVSKQKQLSLI